MSQQLSVESSTSYIHPNEVNIPKTRVVGKGINETNRQKVINTISDDVAKKDDRDYLTVPRGSNVNVQEVDNKCTEQLKSKANVLQPRTVSQQKSANVDSRLKEDDSDYILPNDEQITKIGYVNARSINGHITSTKGGFDVSGNLNVDSNGEYLSPKNNADYANVRLKRTDEESNSKGNYINSPADNPCEINTAEINDAYVDVSCDDTYLPMQGVANKIPNCKHKEDVSEHDINDFKESLTDTDSAGYMSMSNAKNKPALKKMDSTFPNMMSFRAHGTVDKNENVEHDHPINNNFKQNKNKVKRYVKENHIP